MTIEDYIDLNTDYMDMNTMNMYKIQEYNRAKKLGLPTAGIKVVTPEGKLVGYYTPKGDR